LIEFRGNYLKEVVSAYLIIFHLHVACFAAHKNVISDNTFMLVAVLTEQAGIAMMSWALVPEVFGSKLVWDTG
jgi:hypothetical protein